MKAALVPIAFALLLFPLAGCNGLFMVSHERAYEFSHAFTAGDALDVQLSNGDVTVKVVAGGDKIVAKGRIVARAGSPEAAEQLADESEVTIEPGEPTATTGAGAAGGAASSPSGKTLLVRLQKPKDRVGANVSADVELTLPDSMALKLNSSNGTLSVRSNSRPVEARTSNGRIAISDQTGDVTAVTSNGTVEIRSLAGGVHCRSSNGTIDILARPTGSERVVAKTSNGTISVQLPALQSASVWTQTSNGKIRFLRAGKEIAKPTTATSESEAMLQLNTSNGSITVHYEPQG